MRDFQNLEEYLVKDKKLFRNYLVVGAHTQAGQNFLGRHDKQFQAIIGTLQAFLAQIVESDEALRDAKVLDFLGVPIIKRARLNELLPT